MSFLSTVLKTIKWFKNKYAATKRKSYLMYVSWWFPFSAVAMNMAPSIPREFSCRLKVRTIRIAQTFAKANLRRFQHWVHLNQNRRIWMESGAGNHQEIYHDMTQQHSPMMHGAPLSSSVGKPFPPLLPVTNSIFSLSWSFAAPSLQVAEVTDPNSQTLQPPGQEGACRVTTDIVLPLSSIASVTITPYYCSVLLCYRYCVCFLGSCSFVLAHPDPFSLVLAVDHRPL